MGTKTKAIEALARHVLATLPDSLNQRMLKLEQIKAALPNGNDVRLSAQTQLRLIEQMNAAQAEFILELKGPA